MKHDQPKFRFWHSWGQNLFGSGATARNPSRHREDYLLDRDDGVTWANSIPVVDRDERCFVWSITLPEEHCDQVVVVSHPQCVAIRIRRSSTEPDSPLNTLQRAIPRSGYLLGEPLVSIESGTLFLRFARGHYSEALHAFDYKWLAKSAQDAVDCERYKRGGNEPRASRHWLASEGIRQDTS